MTELAEAANSIVVDGGVPGARPSRGLGRRLAATPAWVGGVMGVVLIVLVWWILSVTSLGRSGAIPTPLEVILLFGKAFGDSSYWQAIGATSLAAGEGYLIGNAIAIVLALIVLLNPRSEGFATQLAVVTSCLPLTAIGPLVAIMTQAGSRVTSVFLAALSVIFTTVIGSILGLKSANRTQLDVVSAYGGSRFTQVRKVRLFAALPSFLAALKIAAPAAFLGAVLGEYFLVGVDSGIGILLLNAQFYNDATRVWVLALTSGAIAGLAYFLIDRIGRLLTPWAAGDRGKAAF
ncbi:ABC transporter permease [Amnibacterium kyonggiense]|uniref:ABC-type nitrate/sulfonate/bicarbonate transport system permease component n=1 Tax=Amnibacterium kyonggiense TaxID=595671 RepID=A0A4R7FIP3_9MICO|nr:ABC transporter permease subunit [Amnibacterium kyonggiense]TDS76161.1 ABC-type nitrate/sulfonate/bicarbonate transport system permease component [Amnibacterium kyonggiense]